MDTAKRLADLKEYAETQVDIVNENLSNAFTRLCQDVVADWQRRYPRHRFRIWEGHGMLSTDVSPPLCRRWVTDSNQGSWDEIIYVTVDGAKRGAVATLAAEAQLIHDKFDELDLRVRMNLNGVIGEPL